MIIRSFNKFEKKLFNVDDYYRMLEVGILKIDDRVELIHGEIIRKEYNSSRHAGHTRKLNTLLHDLIEADQIISVHNPVRLTSYSETEPDLAILKRREDFYAEKHPSPKDVFFLIEVADTSVGYDYDIKLPLYAAANIQEVWVLDINAEQLTQHTQPDGNKYLKETIFRKNDTIKCHSIDLELKLNDIL